MSRNLHDVPNAYLTPSERVLRQLGIIEVKMDLRTRNVFRRMLVSREAAVARVHKIIEDSDREGLLRALSYYGRSSK